MIEFFAAHKIAVVLGMAAVALVLVLRHKSGAAGLPAYAVNPYSSTPPSTGSDSGSLALPGTGPAPGSGIAGSSGDAGGTGGAGIGDAGTSTGPGAGPTMSVPLAPEPTATAIAYPDPTSGGAPGTATYTFAMGGPVALPVTDPVSGAQEAPLVGIDARMAHPSPAAVQQAQVLATASAENYAKQFTAAAQGYHTAGF